MNKQNVKNAKEHRNLQLYVAIASTRQNNSATLTNKNKIKWHLQRQKQTHTKKKTEQRFVPKQNNNKKKSNSIGTCNC